MHLSMSSPTYPRSGRRGDLQSWIVKCPTPGDNASVQIPCKSPHFKVGVSRELTLKIFCMDYQAPWGCGVYWRQHKGTPNIVRSTTGLQNTFLMFYKCPYPGDNFKWQSPTNPHTLPDLGQMGLRCMIFDNHRSLLTRNCEAQCHINTFTLGLKKDMKVHSKKWFLTIRRIVWH